MIFFKYKFFKPKYIIFAFDHKYKNFKKNIYCKYKSNRKTKSKNLLIYINNIYNFFKKKKIKTIRIPSIECDDIIGSIIFKIKEKYKNIKYIYILSYDKDFTQLIKKNIYLFIDKNNILDSNKVKKKYGTYPNLIKDLLTLCGDKSDNIPGIKGIGKKTAIKLINNIGNINNIYKNIYKIKLLKIKNSNNIIKNLFKNINNIYIWYNIISIRVNINIEIKNILNKNIKFNEIFKSIKKINFDLNIKNNKKK